MNYTTLYCIGHSPIGLYYEFPSGIKTSCFGTKISEIFLSTTEIVVMWKEILVGQWEMLLKFQKIESKFIDFDNEIL